MFLTIAKIFVVALAILAISKSYLSYKAKRESVIMLIFWVASWIAINIIAFSPKVVNFLLNSLNGRAGVGTLLGLGMVFIYFVVYRVYVKADRIEKQLSKIIRDNALKENKDRKDTD